MEENDGLNLAQYNKDFYGYTVFTLKFNDVPIRFVTEKDASSIVNQHLTDIENRIKLCLRDCNKSKEKGMPHGMDWMAEALGYKTALECINRTKEKFSLVVDSAPEVKG